MKAWLVGFCWLLLLVMNAGCEKKKCQVVPAVAGEFYTATLLKAAGSIAAGEGYSVGRMSVRIEQYYSEENACLPAVLTDEHAQERREKLKGRTYWMIDFGPPKQPDTITFGGGYCVFVDAKTGEVILSFMEV